MLRITCGVWACSCWCLHLCACPDKRPSGACLCHFLPYSFEAGSLSRTWSPYFSSRLAARESSDCPVSSTYPWVTAAHGRTIVNLLGSLGSELGSPRLPSKCSECWVTTLVLSVQRALRSPGYSPSFPVSVTYVGNSSDSSFKQTLWTLNSLPIMWTTLGS